MVLELASWPIGPRSQPSGAAFRPDMTLPAPAIAVNGRDGAIEPPVLSLLEPVPVPKAAAFLDALRRRYLGDIVPVRVAMLPAFDSASARPLVHVRPVPTLQADSGVWSAFVASDLAPMFADEPGLICRPIGTARSSRWRR